MTADWTAADEAEFAALVWQLVDSFFEHRDRCARCSEREPCPHLGRAIDEIVNWRTARILLSRAEALRAAA